MDKKSWLRWILNSTFIVVFLVGCSRAAVTPSIITTPFPPTATATVSPLPPTPTLLPTEIPSPSALAARPLQALSGTYAQLAINPPDLGPDWEFLTSDSYGDEGTCLMYSSRLYPSQGMTGSTILICANTATSDYSPSAIVENITQGWSTLDIGLDFAKLGTALLFAVPDGSSYVAWLPMGEDSLSVQINLQVPPGVSLQDFYDQNLVELFGRAFHKALADAGIPGL